MFIREYSQIISLDLLNLIVTTGPTVLFLLILLGSTLIGYFRGLRKSVILFIHSLVLGIVFVCLYFFLCNSEYADVLFLKCINVFMGKNGLQTALGVSESCSSLRECLVEWIPTLFPLDEAIKLIVEDNGAYLSVLVNLGYHIIFALVCWILYGIFYGILYIIYLIFYSDRKRIARQNEEFMNNKTDASFRKKRLGGSLIGLSRGIISGLIVISLFGGVLYASCGGKGQGTLQNYDFEDADVNYYYNAYQELNRYGKNGIFMVLNAVDNKDEVPYYLYICDLVYQGKFTEVDEEGNSSTYRLMLTDELGSSTKFATEIVSLFMKYGGEDLRNVILGKETDKDTMEILYSLFTNYDFQVEFSECISDLKSLDYINNLALSLVDSICANIDYFDWGVDEKIVDMLKVLFKKGYYSSVIPAELALKEAKRDVVLPYIHSSYLLEEEDTQTILDLVYTLIENQTNDINTVIHRVVTYLSSLSLFKASDKSQLLNPVLARLYSFLENTYLSDPELLFVNSQNETVAQELKVIAKSDDFTLEKLNSVQEVNYLEYLNDSSVDWLQEICSFVDCAKDIMTIYNAVYDASKQPVDMIISIFDKSKSTYSYTISAYDRITDCLSSSHVLGMVLSTKAFMGVITDFAKSLSPSYSEPENIQFDNQYDENSSLTGYGELYYFLKGMKMLASEDNKFILTTLTSEEEFTDKKLIQIGESLRSTYDENGISVLQCLTSSSIIESFLSSFLISESEKGSVPLYFAPESLKTSSEGGKLNILDNEELYEILYYIPDILTEFDLENMTLEMVDNLMYSSYMSGLIDNKIMQSVLGQNIINFVSSSSVEGMIIPNRLKDISLWVDTASNYGEARKLYNSLMVSQLKISSLNFDDQDAVINVFKNLTDRELEDFLSSQIIHYTVSDSISSVKLENAELIIPNNVKTSLENEDISYLISSDEIINFINAVHVLEISEDNNKTFSKLVLNRDKLTSSDIMVASISNYMFTKNDDVKNNISLPSSYNIFSSEEEIESKYSSSGWRSELSRFLLAADELFGISKGVTPDLSQINKMLDDIIMYHDSSSDFVSNKTKMDVYLDSYIVMTTLSDNIDKSLFSEQDSAIIESIKVRDGYYSKQDISYLFSFMKELGLSSERMNQSDYFKSLSITNDDILIKAINDSKLVRYAMTCQIYNSIYCSKPLLRDHPYAYENGILKAGEIITLFDILNSSSIENYSSSIASEISLDTYINILSNSSGKCSSYLIASTISSKIISQINGIVVPKDACVIGSDGKLVLDNVWNSSFDGRPILSEEEIVSLIMIMKSMGNETLKFNDSSVNIESLFNLNFVDPVLLDKSKVLKATILEKFSVKIDGANNPLGLYVSKNNAFVTTDITSYLKEGESDKSLIVINASETAAFLNAFKILNQDNEQGLTSSISYEKICSLYNEGVLGDILNSSIYRIEISQYLISIMAAKGINTSAYTSNEDVLSVSGKTRTSLSTMSKENTLEAVGILVSL